MPNINEITYEGILSEMMEKYRQESGFVPDDASDIAIRLRVLAAQIHSMAASGQWLLGQLFFDTATGEYLDRHAAMQGLTRNSGAKAEGKLTFILNSALTYGVTIPAGTVCTTGDAAGMRFETSEDCVIPAGSLQISVPATAQEEGIAGNAAAGTVRCILSPPVAGLRVTNSNVFRGGRDAEDDEGLRGRIALVCAGPSNGTNAAYYRTAAMSVEGIGSVNVTPRKRGRGTVDVSVAGVGATATDEQVAQVQTLLDASREIGVDVAVAAATTKPISITVKLKSEYGYHFAVQKQKATDIVTDFFNHLSIGETFRYNRLGKRLMDEIDGLVDYDFGVNGLNVAIADTQLAVMGTVTVTEWSV